VLVEILSSQASDDGGEGQLSNAEAQGENICQKHVCGVCGLLISVDWFVCGRVFGWASEKVERAKRITL